MKSLKLANGDLSLDKGELLLVDAEEELEQSVKLCTATNKGEWFLDPDFGLDFYAILGHNPTEEKMRDALLDAFSYEPRIDSIEDLKVEREGRKAKVYYRAILVDGTSIEREVDTGVK